MRTKKSDWFSFSSMLICLRFYTIQLIAIILYTLNAYPRKVNEKCQKTFTKINENQPNFVWIFSIFLRFFFHRSLSLFRIVYSTQSDYLKRWKSKEWNQKKKRENRNKTKSIETEAHTANRMLFLVEFWVWRWAQARTTNIE